MKKLALYCIYFSVVCYTTAQTLYSDKEGVKIFYKIEKTSKSTSCNSNTSTSEKYSNKIIYIWKVVIGIENKHKYTIVPRGVGVANISVSAKPIKPYAADYCNYNRIKNYDPNKGYLDQSLFNWPIKEFIVDEIESGATLTNTTYLYLYDGQVPQLSNWEFLGYRFKKDFKPNHILVTDEKTSNITVIQSSKSANYSSNTNNESSTLDAIEKKDTVIPIVSQSPLASVKENIRKEKPSIETIEIAVIPFEKEIIENLNVKKESSEKIQSIETVKNTNDRLETTTTQECPGEKAITYRNKITSDPLEQKAYSWLALYYTYLCECETGSKRSDGLPILINNVVDSYSANTNDAYGKILKVSTCEKIDK